MQCPFCGSACASPAAPGGPRTVVLPPHLPIPCHKPRTYGHLLFCSVSHSPSLRLALFSHPQPRTFTPAAQAPRPPYSAPGAQLHTAPPSLPEGGPCRRLGPALPAAACRWQPEPGERRRGRAGRGRCCGPGRPVEAAGRGGRGDPLPRVFVPRVLREGCGPSGKAIARSRLPSV